MNVHIVFFVEILVQLNVVIDLNRKKAIGTFWQFYRTFYDS